MKIQLDYKIDIDVREGNKTAKAEALFEQLQEIGGEDQDGFAEELAKNRFETLVSGEGKEKLRTYAQIKGYAAIMHDLDIAKVELEKKQSGE